jgi:hypothetical protein
MKTRTFAATLFVAALTLFFAAPLSSQETAADPADGVEAVLEDRAGDLESTRSRVLRFLERRDVEAIAEDSHIDLERIRDGVRTMESGELARLQEDLGSMDDHFMAGGDRIVITTSTIIIILLVLILIAVA